MNKLKFENTYYDEVLYYAKQYSKTREDGYYKIDLNKKSDQIHSQENNTILALLASLHHRLTLIETKLITLEQQIQGSTSQDWKTSLEILTKDIQKLSIDSPIKKAPSIYSFLTYNQNQSI